MGLRGLLAAHSAHRERAGSAPGRGSRGVVPQRNGAGKRATMAGIGEIVRLARVSTRERGIAGHQQQVEG